MSLLDHPEAIAVAAPAVPIADLITPAELADARALVADFTRRLSGPQAAGRFISIVEPARRDVVERAVRGQFQQGGWTVRVEPALVGGPWHRWVFHKPRRPRPSPSDGPATHFTLSSLEPLVSPSALPRPTPSQISSSASLPTRILSAVTEWIDATRIALGRAWR